MTRSPEYLTWRAMKQRCLNPRAAQFAWYGGRGISICRRWAESFEAFLADVGPRPAGTTLDRHPNRDGNYEPGNVRWATSAEQALNQSQTITLQLDGISDTTDGWAKRTGLSARLIRLRLFRGWSVERTLTAPKSFRGTR
jgi:hypothetical protein